MKEVPVEAQIAVVGPGEWAGIPHSLWFAVRRNGRIIAICELRQDASKLASEIVMPRKRTAA